MRAAAGLSPSMPGSQDLLDLRNEIALAEQGHRQTGQLNPRNPGALNDAVQFGKKVMRRSLAWYTRPLHLFQAAIIRSLQRVANAVEYQRSELWQHSEALNQNTAAIERNKGWMAEQLREQKMAQERLREHTEATFLKYKEQVSGEISRLEGRLANITEIDRRLAQFQEAASRRTGDQDRRLQQLDFHIDAVKETLQALEGKIQQLDGATRQTSSQLRVRERDLRRLLRVVGSEPIQQMSTKVSPVEPMFPSEVKSELEFDYFAFEERYRGDEADTREKQQAYVDYFRDRQDVVDLGCGRGELLDLLRAAGIKARGVELGTDQILLCQEKGLDVVQQDLFTFLESTPDESLGGIFSAQVIEHMTASDQLRYVALAYQKVKPGSPVIFETINPQCVYALVRNFFLDPTHIRPVHPETLQFAMDSCGFRNVELRFSSRPTELHVPKLSLDGNPPGLEAFNAGIERVNGLLYGYQDYAAIGWK